VTFEFDVTSRPNWIWLPAIQDMNRVLILNGVHHLLARLRAGRPHAVCLIRHASSLGDLLANGWNPQDLSLSKPLELTGVRPPLLRDYKDEEQAADIAIRCARATSVWLFSRIQL
jgi:hypothetical protein